MKVLQFIPSLNAKDGGTTTYMQELAPVLGTLVELHVCALGKKENFVILKNATTHSIEISLKHAIRMRRQWLALLEEIKPDIVHINCCWLPQCALVQYWTRQWQKNNIYSQSTKTNYLYLTPHGMLEPWIIRRNYWTKKVPAIWLYQKWAVNDADVIVATAEEERTHISELNWGHKMIALLPNGIDTTQIEMKTEWNDCHELLFMSRIHPKKGLEMLIEAFASSNTDKNRSLTVAGEGDSSYVESLKSLVAMKGLSEQIKFLGPIYGEKKWELIRHADVVILPSYSENFGLIVAEALASGTPVLTTTGTPWRSIEERQCGWWVVPETESIRKTLNILKTMDKASLEVMGKRGRALVEEKFDVKNLASELYNIYLS